MSHPHVAYNDSAAQVSVTNGTFDFNGAWLTATWRNDLNITVEGYSSGVLMYSQTVVVSPLEAQWFDFNFLGVDTLVFTSFGGTSAGLDFDLAHFAMDDFTFNEPAAGPSNNHYSTLGNGPFWLDRDHFTFQGTAGETVFLTLEVDEDGENNGGGRATLALKDRIYGIWFYRSDRSTLPNQITATLPRTGKYRITVAEHPWYFFGKSFRGDYCLTLESTSGELKATPSVEAE